MTLTHLTSHNLTYMYSHLKISQLAIATDKTDLTRPIYAITDKTEKVEDQIRTHDMKA